MTEMIKQTVAKTKGRTEPPRPVSEAVDPALHARLLSATRRISMKTRQVQVIGDEVERDIRDGRTQGTGLRSMVERLESLDAELEEVLSHRYL